jgi:hypothetical protein
MANLTTRKPACSIVEAVLFPGYVLGEVALKSPLDSTPNNVASVVTHASLENSALLVDVYLWT